MVNNKYLKYLLDTSTCIEFLRGNEKVCSMVFKYREQCCISTITEAELFNGAYNVPEKYFVMELQSVRMFIDNFPTVSLLGATEFYSKEKKRLEKNGTPLEDFDIMIGAIGVMNNLSVVTSNTKHFSRIEGIILTDWTKE